MPAEICLCSTNWMRLYHQLLKQNIILKQFMFLFRGFSKLEWAFIFYFILNFFQMQTPGIHVIFVHVCFILFVTLGRFREHIHSGDKVAVHDNWSPSSESGYCQKPNWIHTHLHWWSKSVEIHSSFRLRKPYLLYLLPC